MNITTQTYPWKYFIVDNVLNYEDYISLRKFSEEKNKKYHNIVKKQVLQYEDWDDIHINNIVYNLVKKVKK